MRLSEYLQSRDESQSAFAKRAGIPQSTVNLICNGSGTRTETAIKIVRATGGLVSFGDLTGESAPQKQAG